MMTVPIWLRRVLVLLTTSSWGFGDTPQTTGPGETHRGSGARSLRSPTG